MIIYFNSCISKYFHCVQLIFYIKISNLLFSMIKGLKFIRFTEIIKKYQSYIIAIYFEISQWLFYHVMLEMITSREETITIPILIKKNFKE